MIYVASRTLSEYQLLTSTKEWKCVKCQLTSTKNVAIVILRKYNFILVRIMIYKNVETQISRDIYNDHRNDWGRHLQEPEPAQGKHGWVFPCFYCNTCDIINHVPVKI